MQYLDAFDLPTRNDEAGYIIDRGRNHGKFDMACYANNVYPFHIFPDKGLSHMDFSPITIFYGGNGSGKSTLLNIIAEKLKINRASPFNKTPFLSDYLTMCQCSLTFGQTIPGESRIITSDDVFDFLLDVRCINQGVDNERQALFDEWQSYRDGKNLFQMTSLDDYDELKRRNQARHTTRSDYAHRRLPDNLYGKSNGESAYDYFTDKIRDHALYLLDEPENSLSAGLQVKLANFLEESVRFYHCQLVISTHSPFLLSLKGARIYDLDSRPVRERSWTELENVKVWHDFFEHHREEF